MVHTDRYGVRAADAVQLAAALVWCRERPNRRPFICVDERLCRAATEAGFAVRT
jgi:predicted nucleic acid-binding protein